MKKIIAILLGLALLLCCVSGLAEETGKQTLGSVRVNGEFTLKGVLAEGYRAVPFERSDEAMLVRIVSDDPARPEMMLSIAFDESYYDVERLNDLNDDELAILEETFAGTDPYVNISYDETAYGTRLMICRTTTETYDYLDIFTIYKGYFVEFVMYPGKKAPEQRLTDAEAAGCIAFLSELDFVEGIEEPEAAVEGRTFDAVIEGYDAETKTVEAVLLVPVTLAESQVAALREGDSIQIGTEETEIGTLQNDGNTVIINDEYELRKNPEGQYNPYLYDLPVLTEVKRVTLAIPDSLVFEEGIDPELGDPLEEPRILTAADFFKALEVAENGGIGFDAENIRITFDDDGEPVRIERNYSPAQ